MEIFLISVLVGFVAGNLFLTPFAYKIVQRQLKREEAKERKVATKGMTQQEKEIWELWR